MNNPMNWIYPNDKQNCPSKLPCGICRQTGQQCPYHIEQPSVIYANLTCDSINENQKKK